MLWASGFMHDYKGAPLTGWRKKGYKSAIVCLLPNSSLFHMNPNGPSKDDPSPCHPSSIREWMVNQFPGGGTVCIEHHILGFPLYRVVHIVACAYGAVKWIHPVGIWAQKICAPIPLRKGFSSGKWLIWTHSSAFLILIKQCQAKPSNISELWGWGMDDGYWW